VTLYSKCSRALNCEFFFAAAELESRRLQLEQQRRKFEEESKQAAELDVLKMQLESERQATLSQKFSLE